jgi:hypothetical protein
MPRVDVSEIPRELGAYVGGGHRGTLGATYLRTGVAADAEAPDQRRGVESEPVDVT